MTVIGNGDIASAIPDREDLLFFASGVSNSAETRKSEFEREYNLLADQNHKRHLVYFSSIATFWGNTPYYKHKIDMENLVKKFPKYTIVRMGNIAWGSNPNTLINALKLKLEKGETLEIRDEWRYIVEKEEFIYWMNLIPERNCEIMIPGRRMKVSQILKEYIL